MNTTNDNETQVKLDASRLECAELKRNLALALYRERELAREVAKHKDDADKYIAILKRVSVKGSNAWCRPERRSTR